MGTTAQKLAKLKETKADIKQSIIDKGVTVPSDATFASYPYYIGQISGGSTPTGNIELQKQTGTNVSAYATASVRSSEVNLKVPTIDANGLITASSTLTTSGWIGTAPENATLQLSTQAAKRITPSTATITAVGMNVYTTGVVLVDPMPTGTAGTPTAEKGTVSSNQITITPKVTNTAGYINGGTITGSGVTVTASELVSGTTATTAGTSAKTVSVTNYANITVNPTPSEAKTASAAGNVTPSSGKLLSAVTVPSGTAGTPVATKGSVSNHQITVTPKVTNTAGWVTGQTITGTGVTVSASELVSGTTSTTAGTSAKTVDVTNYASVTVNPTPSEVKTATVNGDVTPSSGKLLSKVTVAVSYNIYRTGSGDPSSTLGNDGDLYVDIS